MSTMGDSLNAGAATFTPGDEGGALEPRIAGRSSVAMSDDSMLEEIEAELRAQVPGFGGGGGSSGNFRLNHLYPDLPPHADEFWFPECRDCTCCNGYKHGCNCCAKEGLRQCKCIAGCPPAGPPPPPPQAHPPHAAAAPHPPPPPPPPAQHQGGWMPAAPGIGHLSQQQHHPGPAHHPGGPPPHHPGHPSPHHPGHPSPHHPGHPSPPSHHHHQGRPPPPPPQGYSGRHPNGGGGRYGGRGNYGGRGRGGGGRGRGGNPPPCRFFFTPNGCRYGDNCRFSHIG